MIRCLFVLNPSHLFLSHNFCSTNPPPIFVLIFKGRYEWEMNVGSCSMRKPSVGVAGFSSPRSHQAAAASRRSHQAAPPPGSAAILVARTTLTAMLSSQWFVFFNLEDVTWVWREFIWEQTLILRKQDGNTDADYAAGSCPGGESSWLFIRWVSDQSLMKTSQSSLHNSHTGHSVMSALI